MKNIKHCISFAGAALLVACATPAPAPAPTQTQTQPSDGKFTVPIGYQKVIVNGQEQYCHREVDTGSRISSGRVCYTAAQLQAQAADTQNNIATQIQNSNTLGNRCRRRRSDRRPLTPPHRAPPPGARLLPVM